MLILADSGPVRQLVATGSDGCFRWIDLVAPDRPTLQGLVDELSLPEPVAEDCLDMHQLPKVERHGDAVFILLRMHVGPMNATATGAYEITQPLAIYVARDLLLTIHRRDHAVIARLRARCAANQRCDDEPAHLLDELIRESVSTFDAPLDQLSVDLVDLDGSLLSARMTERVLEQVFLRKRRASVLAWMLQRTREALARTHLPGEQGAALHEARDAVDALHFRAREVAEHIDNLLNLQIAVASHRTNEVMRVLTVMSAIFMPLTFVVGVYGMNFDAPEFHWRYGYISVWFLILAVLLAVLGWFQRRGWLR
ncbi:MAG TPA: CorA family divalent cation transporter [Gemmatimonadaceae bacterium]|jgi:magnesium transporter